MFYECQDVQNTPVRSGATEPQRSATARSRIRTRCTRDGAGIQTSRASKKDKDWGWSGCRHARPRVPGKAWAWTRGASSGAACCLPCSAHTPPRSRVSSQQPPPTPSNGQSRSAPGDHAACMPTSSAMVAGWQVAARPTTAAGHGFILQTHLDMQRDPNRVYVRK